MKEPAAGYRLTTRGMRIMLVVASLLVLSVGISLNMLTEQTDKFFAWTIATPLTAAFLGAAYWSSAAMEFLASREKYWVNARIAVPAVFLFTLLTLIVTLVHFDRFHFNNPDMMTVAGTWVWLAVYAIVPIAMGILWFQQSRVKGNDPPRRWPVPAWQRALVTAQAVVMIPLGVTLLLVPEVVIPYWPWALTPLTGRAIGAWSFSIGVAAAQAAWENDLERVRIATLSYLAIGVLEFIALARYAYNVNWNSVSAWLYVLFLVSLLVAGAAGWMTTRRLSLAAPVAEPVKN